MSGEGDFWSRRKAAVAAEEEAEVAAADAEALEAEVAALEGKTEAEVLEELGLPDPDTLGKGDDFSVFLKGPVPEAIRRRALRRLWRSNPVLANVDNLVEYGEDYTKTNVGVEGLKTAYEVGRGFWKRIAEEEAAAAASAEAADEGDAADEVHVALAPDSDDSADPPEYDMAKDTADTSVDESAQPEVEDIPTLQRRRMRFRFLD